MSGRFGYAVSLLLIAGVSLLLGQSLGLLDPRLLSQLPLPDVLDHGSDKSNTPTPRGELLIAGSQASLESLPTDSLAPASPPASDHCTDDLPRFIRGLASLKLTVGAAMGEPLECEHLRDAAGTTGQRTTTGLAYYLKGSDIPAFTNGWDHWALSAGGLVHWTGVAVDPPTEPEIR